MLIRFSLRKSCDVYNFALVVRPSDICSRLNSEDEEVKQKLVKCSAWTYFELIRSDIPGPSGVKPSRPSELSSAKSSRPSALGHLNRLS